MEKFRIREPGWKKVGSGINISDPQHCIFEILIFYYSAWTHQAQSPTPRQLSIRSASLCVDSVIKRVTLSKVKYGVRSPKFIWAPCAQLYTLAETSQPQPLPPHLGSYTSELLLLVSQDRRHLFVAPILHAPRILSQRHQANLNILLSE
jgi:hypothetical protein